MYIFFSRNKTYNFIIYCKINWFSNFIITRWKFKKKNENLMIVSPHAVIDSRLRCTYMGHGNRIERYSGLCKIYGKCFLTEHIWNYSWIVYTYYYGISFELYLDLFDHLIGFVLANMYKINYQTTWLVLFLQTHKNQNSISVRKFFFYIPNCHFDLR